MTIRLNQQLCPICRHVFDAATVMGKEVTPMPKKGDLTVCIACSSVLVFDDQRVAQKPKLGELEAMYKENKELRPKIREIQRGMMQLHLQNSMNNLPKKAAS